MNRIRKWWKPVLALVLAGLGLQFGVSLLARTARVRSFLTRQLESSFGRPVEVREFSASLLPSPQLDAYAISVGEDPAFGNEYFLRADRLSAGLRWGGILRGRFELGALQLDHPSLTLVRNREAQWNLERWLPSAGAESKTNGSVVHATAAPPTHHLQKIEINDGRVNFKIGEDKTSFAFQQVEGSVEQTAAGRWRLDLEAEPWRSGIPLQLAGTVRVSGEVAGTSVRLRPAHLRMSWAKSSLADVFRLIGGSDFGVRGTFAGEATADSDESSLPETKDAALGDWAFTIQTRATEIHRWDLAERADNPRIGLRLKGRWNPATGITEAREVVIETPRSNLRGTASMKSTAGLKLEIRLDSAGLQAADFLNWCRAFQPDVSEEIAVSQYFTGTAIFRGWPLKLEEAAFSSPGGRWILPGFSAALNVRAIRGGTQRGKLQVEPFTVSVPARKVGSPGGARTLASAKDSVANPPLGNISVSIQEDLEQRSGSVHIEGQAPQVEALLAITSAFGHDLRHGWDLTGRASGDLRWEWNRSDPAEWNGHADLARATLQVAGLNQAIQLENLRADWRGARRKFSLGKVGAFGATWSGTVEQLEAVADGGSEESQVPHWTFQLQADQLDAAELDRWIGPRARPSWLQRLLPAALGGNTQVSPSSAVLKQLRADGDLKVAEIAVEKIVLKSFRARVSLNGLKLKLENAQAQWSGGLAQGRLVAALSASPKYEVSASFEHVSLVQTPWLEQLADHLGGTASGSIELEAKGIGREALLKSLAGKGELQLNRIELRGWDLAETMAQGEWKKGSSHWPGGSATFHLSDGGFELNALRLASPSEEFLLKGSVSFSQDTDLTAESHLTGRTARPDNAVRFLTISGPLHEPKVSLERATAQQPGD
ncbi:MAG TPA: AsmA family protein [Candidatus Acidoferrum sp.]|nr:AsmA family protein [Candidatus Acidoferrum sp.]